MDFLAQMEADEANRSEIDSEAKERGDLVGRYIQVPAADGYAIYIVTKVKGKIVHLDHSNIGDAWTDGMIESMGREIPLKFVKENIERRDKLAKLFPVMKLKRLV